MGKRTWALGSGCGVRSWRVGSRAKEAHEHNELWDPEVGRMVWAIWRGAQLAEAGGIVVYKHPQA